MQSIDRHDKVRITAAVFGVVALSVVVYKLYKSYTDKK